MIAESDAKTVLNADIFLRFCELSRLGQDGIFRSAVFLLIREIVGRFNVSQVFRFASAAAEVEAKAAATAATVAKSEESA